MFTGIVEEVGRIERIQRGSRSATLAIGARRVLEDTQVGDSIAVNGVCLTVTSLSPSSFTADVMHETLDRSGLAQLKIGSKVNLERAMSAQGRFGGHIVSGHIDGVGTVTKTERDDTAIWYSISAPEDIVRYVVEKGSIAIDGISLTVARVDGQEFAVSTIPHTNAATTLVDRAVGDTVNLECDIIGKYVERFVQQRPTQDLQEQLGTEKNEQTGGLTLDFLAEHGF